MVTGLKLVDACTARLGLELVDDAGAAGVMKASENVWHIIVVQGAPAL